MVPVRVTRGGDEQTCQDLYIAICIPHDVYITNDVHSYPALNSYDNTYLTSAFVE